MLTVLGQRIGGSGHASMHLCSDFEDGHIPFSWKGQVLKRATLNLVLQAGYVFRTPKSGGATNVYISRNRETYYLQAIQLSVIDGNSKQPRNPDPFPGLIHRNDPHPSEFDNVIEVIAPDISAVETTVQRTTEGVGARIADHRRSGRTFGFARPCNRVISSRTRGPPATKWGIRSEEAAGSAGDGASGSASAITDAKQSYSCDIRTGFMR
jgi:hypothetical protein